TGMDDNPYRTGAADSSVVDAESLSASDRPVGIVLLALVHLVSGLYIAGQRWFMLVNIYSTSPGSITMSASYKVMLFGEVLIVVVAITSAVGLFVGAKWGWWLAAFHWTWRIAREVLIPLSALILTGLSNNAETEVTLDFAEMFVPVILQSLLLLYLFKENVLEFFRFDSLSKPWAIAALFSIGFIVAFVLDGMQSIIQ
ncbi:MAG: hypothetical protein J3T61_11690, partial [Candidatus Brocadiales bacterium]|nr:hypothetical protein [Candidatus Bathyanammoxibius sp.]